MTQRHTSEKIGKWVLNHLGGAQSLRRKALFGGGWLLGRSVALGVIDLTRTAVFARVLEAHDYGVMALVTMVSGMLNAFTFLGLDVLIQRDGEGAEKHFPVYWTIKMVRACICFLTAQILAIPLATYYEQPKLVFLIRVMSMLFFIEGIAGFGKEKCQQQMRFGRLVRTEIVLTLVSFGLGTAGVFWLKNATALVINQLLTAGVQLGISYILFPWKPKIGWNRAVFKRVLLFSGSVIAINILNYILTSFDRATVGKLFTMEILGFYARGHFLSQIPVTYFSMIIAPVFMPAYKKIGDDPIRLRKALFKVMIIYTAFFILLGGAMALFAKRFILIVYGTKWLPVLPVFRILLIYGVSKSIVSACQPVFFLRDKPWIISINAGIMVTIFCSLCVPLTKKYGIEGTAWSIVAGALVAQSVSVIEAFGLTFVRPKVSSGDTDEK